MVNIVLVSHNNKLVQGAYELLHEMIKDKIKICAVGGTCDGQIGVDTDTIINAIENASSEDGIVLIADIGSSVINSMKAIEVCKNKYKVKLADCPFIEGAVAAAVEASIDGTLEEVIKAAEETREYHKNMSI